MKFKPEHFDILGVFCFAFILVCGAYILATGGLAIWATKLLIIIGIGGVVVDGMIVYRYFLRKKR